MVMSLGIVDVAGRNIGETHQRVVCSHLRQLIPRDGPGKKAPKKAYRAVPALAKWGEFMDVKSDGKKFKGVAKEPDRRRKPK